jgi:hypothetical protein
MLEGVRKVAVGLMGAKGGYGSAVSPARRSYRGRVKVMWA